MSYRTPSRAVAALRTEFEPILGCIAPYVTLLVDANTGAVGRLRLPPSHPHIALRAPRPLLFEVTWWYRFVSTNIHRWEARVVRYEYRISHANEQEILGFHWHPDVPGSVAFPHLHASSDTAPLSHKTHVSTGFVSLGAVVRLLIAESGVSPLRDDWRTLVGGEE